MSDLAWLWKWLTVKSTITWAYPLPDNKITIQSWSTILWYQWEVWTSVKQILSTNSENFKDPLDKANYTYLTNATKNKFQLLAFLENKWSLSFDFSPLTQEANWTSYTTRYPYTSWDSLWILLSSTWWGNATYTPLQDTSVTWSVLDITTAWSTWSLTAIISSKADWSIQNSTWVTISWLVWYTATNTTTTNSNIGAWNWQDWWLDLSLWSWVGWCNWLWMTYSAWTCTLNTTTKAIYNFSSVNIPAWTTLTASWSTFLTINTTWNFTVAGSLHVNWLQWTAWTTWAWKGWVGGYNWGWAQANWSWPGAWLWNCWTRWGWAGWAFAGSWGAGWGPYCVNVATTAVYDIADAWWSGWGWGYGYFWDWNAWGGWGGWWSLKINCQWTLFISWTISANWWKWAWLWIWWWEWDNAWGGGWSWWRIAISTSIFNNNWTISANWWNGWQAWAWSPWGWWGWWRITILKTTTTNLWTVQVSWWNWNTWSPNAWNWLSWVITYWTP